jgi:hypothetical protein
MGDLASFDIVKMWRRIEAPPAEGGKAPQGPVFTRVWVRHVCAGGVSPTITIQADTYAAPEEHHGQTMAI